MLDKLIDGLLAKPYWVSIALITCAMALMVIALVFVAIFEAGGG